MITEFGRAEGEYACRAMTSWWAAVGAETDLLWRARQLQKSWERLLVEGALGSGLSPGATLGLRPRIVESWRRSLAKGLDPTDLLAPVEADESEVLKRWSEHPLGSLSHVLTDQLRELAEESRGIVVVTDASGLVLRRVGDEGLKERAAEMNLVEGARYNEAADGTNGIGTALAADHAFQVFAFEHFNERHHNWVCSGAPVHDPVSGQTVGLIDVSTLWKTAHPRSLELVTTAARGIERCLVDARRDRDARLRRRYSDFMTRSTDRLVDRDGYVLDGAGLGHPSPIDIPEGGGEVVLGDGSVAVAAPLGRGEAFLLRHGTTRGAKSAPAAKGLERAEERARELATEQAALRHVASLVARESSPDQLFAVVAEQVARMIDVPHVRLVRYEPDGSVVVGGFSEGDHQPFPVGSRWPLDGPGAIATVRRTGRPARVEDYAQLTGELAAVVRGAGMRSAVASPIVVERLVWGAMVVLSPRDEPLPQDTEARLADFTELVASAIANAESREARAVLTDEQAALRRVATLVAQVALPAEIFSTVSNEVATLFRTEMVVVGKFDGDPVALLVVGVGDGTGEPVVGSRWMLDDALASAAVYHTGLPARFDHDSTISDPRVAGIVERFRPIATVAVPVKVEGRLWGAMIVSSRAALLPRDTEERLQRFTDLIATALANAEARAEVERLAEEQAALRRLAVLVAQQPSPSEVFTAVTKAVGLVLGADLAALHVFQGDGTGMTIAGWSGDGGPVPPNGSRFPLHGDSVAAHIFETGTPARMDSYAEAEGEGADLARTLRLRSTVGAPILVEGKLWGALLAGTRGVEPWADNAETRIAAFTELVATAISNAESREALAGLAAEQAALRRVATLVARGAQPDEVCLAVSDEVGRLFGTELAAVGRFEPDGRALDVVGAGRIHQRWELADFLPATEVLRTGHSARADASRWESAEGETVERLRSLGVVSTAASPIIVEDALWGVMTVADTDKSLPPETEERLEKFTELVATAIANAESREARAVLTEEQSALGRVATLVAEAVPASELFAAVALEVSTLFGAAFAGLARFEGESVLVVGESVAGTFPPAARLGSGWPSASAEVLRTGRSARVDGVDWSEVSGPLGAVSRHLGIASTVASPIVVEGRTWGAVSISSTDEALPHDTEERLEKFSDLVATAIANAEGRSELAASRRRIVAASDDARRRIERDLHDGVQQQLVSLGLELGAMKADPRTGDALREKLATVTEDVRSVFDALVEIARGIHPAILSQGGLAAALKALGRRSAVPVELHAQIEGPLTDQVEVAAYYVVAEALTNAAKHARASVVQLDVTTNDGTITLMVRDDGVGGAAPGGGSGLVGLQDRVEALGGTITIDSPAGTGTCVVVVLPIATEPDQEIESFLRPPQEPGSLPTSPS
jgi:signal transduction histidine kinase